MSAADDMNRNLNTARTILNRLRNRASNSPPDHNAERMLTQIVASLRAELIAATEAAQTRAAGDKTAAGVKIPGDADDTLLVLPAWALQIATRYAIAADDSAITDSMTALLRNRWATTPVAYRAAITADAILYLNTRTDEARLSTRNTQAWTNLLRDLLPNP